MLGSFLGLRGIDKKRGRKHLELGIQMLVKKEDFSGAWVGWNNLGELLWKSSEFRSSAFHLQRALEMASNLSMKLETLRNLLELHLRKDGSNSKRVDQILQEIETHHFDEAEGYEQMQLFNSLAFGYLLRGELKKAKRYLKKTIPFTACNEEYHLYTLCNLALLFKVSGLNAKAEVFWTRAMSIAKQKNHYGALDQMTKNLQLFEKEMQKKFTHR